MRLLLLTLVAVLAATEPAPLPALVDDAAHAEHLRSVLAAVPGKGADPWLRWQHLTAVAEASSHARDYARAEAAYRALAALFPEEPTWRSNLSVVLGKQGRADEALAETDAVLAAAPHHLHARLVRPSWLWQLGRTADAEAAFGIRPTTPS